MPIGVGSVVFCTGYRVGVVTRNAGVQPAAWEVVTSDGESHTIDAVRLADYECAWALPPNPSMPVGSLVTMNLAVQEGGPYHVLANAPAVGVVCGYYRIAFDPNTILAVVRAVTSGSDFAFWQLPALTPVG